MDSAIDAPTAELRSSLLDSMGNHVYSAEPVFREQLFELDTIEPGIRRRS
ncbi:MULTISPECIES: hypothetical protein [Nocardia]|nr:hypothetical protein [Nocardia neocaledoniensis]